MEVVCNLGLSYLGLQYIDWHFTKVRGVRGPLHASRSYHSCELRSLAVLSFCKIPGIYVQYAIPLDVSLLSPLAEPVEASKSR